MMNEGSFPREFYFTADHPDEGGEMEAGGAMALETKPRILLMGMRRSGKSSIQKVVFYKMAPNDTLFLESTIQIVKEDISNSSFVQFQIWDIPGQFLDMFSPESFDFELIFGAFGSLIFVIDAQDEYVEALAMLRKVVSTAHRVNPSLTLDVFIHKVDGIAADVKGELQRDILQRVSDDLAEDGLDELRLTYHLTSIYDHSIYEAFSRVVQKLIPQLPTLENLLDIFIANSGIEKVFLFDVISKIYIATDSSPVEMQCYELCCDMIDVVLDVSCIYGENVEEDNSGFDSESSSTIKLNNQTVLYLREINKHLALVSVLRADSFERRGLIDYNFMCLRRAIKDVFNVGRKESPAAGGEGPSGGATGGERSESAPTAASSDALPVTGTTSIVK